MKKLLRLLPVVIAALCTTYAQEADCRPVYRSHDYHGAEILINHISEDNNRVQLVDGSHWTLSSYDRSTVANWQIDDLIVIHPCPYFFSSYVYSLHNLSVGTYALANLSIGPVVDSIYTHWIKGINFKTGQILLENETVWKIYTGGQDGLLFANWQPHDTIILGVNNSFFTSYPHILINVSQDVNQYVRARIN